MTVERPSLTLIRRINASPARIYQAWTRPEQMMRWWGPDAGPVLIAVVDVRLCGRFRVVFQMLDGEKRDCSGVYREVEPDRRLVFTWHWADIPEHESLVTVVLRVLPEGTELALTHSQLDDERMRDSHREGWSGALDKLQQLFASPGESSTETP